MEMVRNLRQRKSRPNLLEARENPYTDFAVLLPFGERNLKRHKCVGKSVNGKGELVSVELVGPATYE